jgi:hypothetical protein
MKKNKKIILTSLLLIILITIDIILYLNLLNSYLIVTITLTIINFIVLISNIFDNSSKESNYTKELNRIFKLYDSVLVQCTKLPNINDKNIIRTNSIEDLIDAQIEVRKPIYYQKQTESCSFILIEQDEAIVYILKLNEEVISPLEIVFSQMDIENKKKDSKGDYKIFNEIDKTMIVKLDNNKAYKVSPILDKKKETEIEIL